MLIAQQPGQAYRPPVVTTHVVRQCMTRPQAIGHVQGVALPSRPASDHARVVEVGTTH